MATFYNLWLQHKDWSFGYFCDSQQAAKNKPPKICCTRKSRHGGVEKD